MAKVSAFISLISSMKRVVFLLCLIVVFKVARAYDAQIDGVYYNLNFSTKTAIVTNEKDKVVTGSDIYTGIVVIPESILFNGKSFKITEIGKYAFFGSDISSISLPSSIVKINDRAFFGCEKLQSLEIPTSVKQIGIYAFAECVSISKLFIPESVVCIEEGAFTSCSGLDSIIVADHNPQYDSRNNCNAIVETKTNTIIAGCKNSVIPNTIVSIGIQSFAGCKELSSIKLPNSVTDIGECAFAGSSLSNITIPSSVNFIGSAAFQNTHLKTIRIPKSIITIGSVAFSGNDSLTTIYLEDDIGLIYNNAFVSCENLKDVYCYSEDVPFTKGDGIFGGYYQDAILHVPQKVIDKYKNNAVWSRQFKKIVSIEDESEPNILWLIIAFAFVLVSFLFWVKVKKQGRKK